MAKPKQLSEELVQRIRTLYNNENYTQKKLANEFSLSQSTICKIVNKYIHRYSNIIFSGEANVKLGYKYGN